MQLAQNTKNHGYMESLSGNSSFYELKEPFEIALQPSFTFKYSNAIFSNPVFNLHAPSSGVAKFNVILIMSDKNGRYEASNHVTQIREIISSVASQMNSSELDSISDRLKLSNAIADKLNGILDSKVSSVIFPSFKILRVDSNGAYTGSNTISVPKEFRIKLDNQLASFEIIFKLNNPDSAFRLNENMPKIQEAVYNEIREIITREPNYFTEQLAYNIKYVVNDIIQSDDIDIVMSDSLYIFSYDDDDEHLNVVSLLGVSMVVCDVACASGDEYNTTYTFVDFGNIYDELCLKDDTGWVGFFVVGFGIPNSSDYNLKAIKEQIYAKRYDISDSAVNVIKSYEIYQLLKQEGRDEMNKRLEETLRKAIYALPVALPQDIDIIFYVGDIGSTVPGLKFE